VQASADGSTTKTRFGININPDSVPISTATLTYDTGDSGVVANSTLQVNGSISNSTFTTTGALTLTEDHYAIILGGNHQITLPAASGSKGRIYIIKNPTNSSTVISSYRNNLNVLSTSISTGSSLWIQSDGTNWQQISAAKVVSGDVGNLITSGSDGGAYLGSTIYIGSFYLNPPGNTASTPRTGTITGIPFQPSQVSFVAHANVDSDLSGTAAVTLDAAGSGANDINNSFGTMNGFARLAGTNITQQVMYVGGSGQSINNISRYGSNVNSIGIRYGNQDGADLGKIIGNVTGFTTNGFTISVTYTASSIAATSAAGIYSEGLMVFYTAYK
jgi:hypothetical protein